MTILVLEVVMRGTFYVLLGIFCIYSLFLGYHWFTYGTNARVSTIALSVYLFGGAIAFLVMGAFLV